MKVFLGLLVGSTILVAMTKARSLDRDEPVQELQTGNLDGQDQKRPSTDGSKQEYHDMYGDVQQVVTNCVRSIAKRGIKRSRECDIEQVMQFCRAKRHRPDLGLEDDCKRASASIGIAKDQCDVLTHRRKRVRDDQSVNEPVTELCKTLVPPKKSKADCKPNQLFGQVLGGPTTPMCFDAPLNKRSQTRVLPIRMYRPFLSKNFAQLQNLTDSTQVQGHDPTTAYAQTRVEKVIIKTLPIGQGDCTVIYCPIPTGQVHVILFDCGARGGTYLPIEYFQRHLVYYTDVNSVNIPVSSITVMISHGHSDHYNRIPKVFDFNSKNGQYLISKIREVIVGGPEGDYSAKTISSWLTNIAKHKPVYFIHGNKYHKLPDQTLKITLCPDQDIVFEIATRTGPQDPRKKNERGMVMKLSCTSCGSQLLLAGDMEGESADEMVTHYSALLKATHYKMAHHGAITEANKENWLKAISPVEVHVSHRHNGGYKHPRCDAFIGLWSSFGTAAPIGSDGQNIDCFDTNRNLVHYTNVYHRVYSTAPISDVLCAITLTFSSDSNVEKRAETKYYCGKVEDFNANKVEDIILPDLGEDKEED